MAVQTSDAASIHLLRRLRAGEDIHFVHRADVCSAAPADLVAHLQPAPGTHLTDDDGYSRVWYFYCAKKYKNAAGKASGHRQRAIAGGDTCWRSELSAKDVAGSNGGTFCNLSYGRKMNGGSGRSFDRMGWCMVEYDDSKGGGGDHVLCKVYRSSSSLAKGKSKSSKRKAAVTDQPADARPAKFAHHEQHNYNTPFTMVGDGNNRHDVQQQHIQQEVAGGFIDTEYDQLNQDGDEVIWMQCGLVAPVVNQATVDEMLGPDPETMHGGVMPTAGAAPGDNQCFGEQIQQFQQEPEAWAPATKKIVHEEQEDVQQQHATSSNNDDKAFDQQLVDILSQDDLECLHHMLQGTSFNDDDYAAPYHDPRDVQLSSYLLT